MGAEQPDRGAVAIIVALVMLVLAGIAAIALDGGSLYRYRSDTQNAADNAALAAAWEDCVGGGDPVAVGLEIAAADGYNNDGVTNTVSIAAVSGGWEAAVDVAVNGSFSRVFGANSLGTGARALAECEVGGGGGYAIFAGSSTCPKTIDWSGSSNNVDGNVHSNNVIDVGGSSNTVTGQGSYVNGSPPGGSNITWNPPTGNPSSSGILPYPVDYDIADYRPGGSSAQAAASVGRYYNFGSSKIDMGAIDSPGDLYGQLWNSSTQTLADGIYRTANDIDLSASDLTGSVTLIADPPAGSSVGVINLGGSNHNLDSFADDLLAFSTYPAPTNSLDGCSSPAIKLSGSGHEWSGIIYSPNGLIEYSGSSGTSVNGSLIGLSVRLNGSVNGVTFDASLGGGNPKVGLRR